MNNVYTAKGSFRIEALENGTYRIFDQDEKVGVIYTQAGNQELKWGTMDDLPESFLRAWLKQLPFIITRC